MLLPLLLVYGALGALAALLVQVVLLSLFGLTASWLLWTQNLASFVLIPAAAFIEEGSKWLFLRQFYLRFVKRMPMTQRFLVGSLFAVGFFTVELGLIMFGWQDAPLGALAGIFFVHLLTSLFFSYSLFQLTPRALYRTWFLVISMTLLHVVYNYAVLTNGRTCASCWSLLYWMY